MRIELIHPSDPNALDDCMDAPLGLLLIASYLRLSKDNEVVVNDLSGIDESDWCIGEADVYGITVYATSLRMTERIVGLCKAKNPNSIVVVGGAHPSCLSDSSEFMNNSDIDFVVVGEGEIPMANIASRKLENILTHDMKGKVVFAEPFDHFLFPSFDLIDVNSYHRKVGEWFSLPLVTAKGCPFTCAFCGRQKMHELGGSVRFASPENVFSQIKRIQIEFGIHAINFQDDTFTLNKDRLFRMLDLIKPLDIKFRCNGRAGYDNEEVYRRLAEAGCSQVVWGIESGSQYMLDRMNKKVKVQDNYDVISWAKKYGISSRALLLIGFPGETKETLEETKEFIKRAEPDQFLVFSMACYPGTDVWNNPSKYGIVKLDRNFDQYYQVGKDGLGGMSFDTEQLSREEFRELEIEFRSWMKSTVEFRGSLQDYEKELYGTTSNS